MSTTFQKIICGAHVGGHLLDSKVFALSNHWALPSLFSCKLKNIISHIFLEITIINLVFVCALWAFPYTSHTDVCMPAHACVCACMHAEGRGVMWGGEGVNFFLDVKFQEVSRNLSKFCFIAKIQILLLLNPQGDRQSNPEDGAWSQGFRHFHNVEWGLVCTMGHGMSLFCSVSSPCLGS